MKKLFSVLIACILLLSAQAQEIKKMKIDELANYIAQSDHPLIVNFWATFCGPCIREIPYFQVITEKYKEKNVELILVSLDLPSYYPSKISSFAKEKNIVSTIVWLDETNADYFCPKIDKKWSGGIPSTLFINNKKKYRQFFERQLTDLQVEQSIKNML
ncbi:MAG: TlpA family protein disulfide reductase [Bacteroidetes bacterium]|nr:TlpA family protein disulfide reductase [Bacteroidota bacterium]